MYDVLLVSERKVTVTFTKQRLGIIACALICIMLALPTYMNAANSLTSYQVVFATTNGGTTDPSGTNTYNAGQRIQISATPNSGYSFLTWSANPSQSVSFDNASSASSIATINGDSTITAIFVQITYRVSFGTVGSASTIPSGTHTYSAGQQVTINAIPDTGYSFSSWSVDPIGSASFDNASSASATATINGACTIIANCVQNTYSLSVITVGSGSVVKSPNQASYHNGDVVVLTATPASGWGFSGWTGAFVSNSNPVSVIINDTISVTATFTQITYQVSFGTIGSGSTIPSGTHIYNAGQQVKINATADSGYSFLNWSSNPVASVSFDNASSTNATATINGDATVTANFAQNAYNLSISIVGNGSIANNPNQASYHYGDIVVLTATSSSGWSFGGWSGGFVSNSNPVSLIINGTTAVTATFTQITYPVSFVVNGDGTANPSGTQTFYANQKIQINAIPAQDYSFSSWSADPIGAVTFGDQSSSSTTATINGACTITAIFTQIPPTPSPTSTSTSNISPTVSPTSTSRGGSSPSPTPQASPSPVSNSMVIQAEAENNSTVNLLAKGDLSQSQIVSASIATDHSSTTTISLSVVSGNGVGGFANITIPKKAILYGTVVAVYVNGGPTTTQGYTQDAKNYYVWYTTPFPTYELQITFIEKQTPIQFPTWIIVGIAVPVIIAAIVIVLMKGNKIFKNTYFLKKIFS